jgi:hypothetical protein
MPNFDPTSNYSGVSNYGSDPYSNYGGSGYGSSYGASNPAYQAYESQLLQYINQVKSALTTLQAGTALYNQYSQYLNTAYQYLQTVDPQMAYSTRTRQACLGSLSLRKRHGCTILALRPPIPRRLARPVTS